MNFQYNISQILKHIHVSCDIYLTLELCSRLHTRGEQVAYFVISLHCLIVVHFLPQSLFLTITSTTYIFKQFFRQNVYYWNFPFLRVPVVSIEIVSVNLKVGSSGWRHSLSRAIGGWCRPTKRRRKGRGPNCPRRRHGRRLRRRRPNHAFHSCSTAFRTSPN
jgi:hypothetical protein